MADSLSAALLTDLVSTLDLFLTSNNREIVRSVLGFVKVCAISLPAPLMLPRLDSLVPNLMVWSHEHKAHFKAKVKHILERMMRRFGVEAVERVCPEEDRKLISNIRKARERSKLKKKEEDEGGEAGDDDKRKGRFESEFDEAVYGSDDSDDSAEEDGSDDAADETVARRKQETFIIEDEAEPLDLLDRKALANISSTKPVGRRAKSLGKAKMNQDGILILGGERSAGDAMALDTETVTNGNSSGGGSVNAYIEALKGKDAVQRGQRGRLKFSNSRKDVDSGAVEDGEGDEMDLDVPVLDTFKRKFSGRGGIARAGRKRGDGGRGRGQDQRRGLEARSHGSGGGGSEERNAHTARVVKSSSRGREASGGGLGRGRGRGRVGRADRGGRGRSRGRGPGGGRR